MGRLLPLLVGLIFVVGGQPALACSCAQSSKPQLVERAGVIFTGEAKTFARTWNFTRGCSVSSADPVTFSFEVRTVYKGDVPKNVDVHTVVSGASCGYEFETGKLYTVFASLIEGRLETNLCGGTVAGTITPAEYGLAAGTPPRP
jgi:hypothetical protein